MTRKLVNQFSRMYYQSKLSNGICLLTIPVEHTKAVTILILFPAGSRYEEASSSGASHFIEHMMFKGTIKRPSNLALARELDSIGAQYNAFTSKDHTGYWIKTVKEKLSVGLDILSDMLFNSVFDKGEFEREKGVVSEEIKMYKENPLLYISDFFDSIVYKGHALGRLISGSVSEINRISKGKLLHYKEKFYQPSQMVIAIAGDIRKVDALNLVKQYFYSYQGKKQKSAYVPWKSRRTSLNQRVSILYRHIDQAQIALGGFSYPYQHPRSEALALLLVILGGNMSSRLFSEVRVKQGLAYFVKADVSTYSDVGNYSIRTGVDKNRTKEAIAVILNELKKIQKFGVSEEELKRAKDYFKGTLKLSLEDSANLVSWYGEQVLLGKTVLSPWGKLKKIHQVTRKDIHSVARSVLNPQELYLALIGPFKNKKSFLYVLEKGV